MVVILGATAMVQCTIQEVPYGRNKTDPHMPNKSFINKSGNCTKTNLVGMYNLSDLVSWGICGYML